MLQQNNKHRFKILHLYQVRISDGKITRAKHIEIVQQEFDQAFEILRLGLFRSYLVPLN